MARIECPKCGHVEETTGLITVCPKCKADLRHVMDDLARRREKLREVAHDDSVTTHEFIVRTKGLQKIYRMGEVEVPRCAVSTSTSVAASIFDHGPVGLGQEHVVQHGGRPGQAHQGTCYIEEVDMAHRCLELAWLRCRKIGYIFQTFNLIPVMTALENVTLPMIFAGMSSDEMMERGAMLLDLVGLGERLHHKPYELSGGQQQRVAVARSLANNPAIILADEPTGNLDLQTGSEIIDLLRELNEESGVTVISATHDLKDDRCLRPRRAYSRRPDRAYRRTARTSS